MNNNYFERLYSITKENEEVNGCPVYIAGTWVNTGDYGIGRPMLDVEGNGKGAAWLYDDEDLIEWFGVELLEYALKTLENGAD